VLGLMHGPIMPTAKNRRPSSPRSRRLSQQTLRLLLSAFVIVCACMLVCVTPSSSTAVVSLVSLLGGGLLPRLSDENRR
jgi:hypothetical protein